MPLKPSEFYTIIYTPNRVVRRLTIHEPPPMQADETAIVRNRSHLPAQWGEEGLWWKLDAGNNFVPATAQEATDAGVNEAGVATTRRQLGVALYQALNPPASNATTAQVRTWCINVGTAFRAFLRDFVT